MRLASTVLFLCFFSAHVWANETKLDTVKVETDLATIERGAGVLMNTCHSCHTLKYIKYRDLISFGMDKQKVDEWRGEESLDSPLLAQMLKDDAIASFGTAPPDLSLMVKARDGGADYVYSYLLGYYLNADGELGNHFYPPTKMPDILNSSTITAGAELTEIQNQARDIVSFLSWVADPHAQERIRLGYYVIAYLVVLTALLYVLKKQIWSKLK